MIEIKKEEDKREDLVQFIKQLRIFYKKGSLVISCREFSQMLTCLMHLIIHYDHINTAMEKLDQSNKEDIMDRAINKVKKDIQHDDKKKALKDTNKLLKLDKSFDKKLEKAHLIKKKK